MYLKALEKHCHYNRLLRHTAPRLMSPAMFRSGHHDAAEVGSKKSASTPTAKQVPPSGQTNSSGLFGVCANPTKSAVATGRSPPATSKKTTVLGVDRSKTNGWGLRLKGPVQIHPYFVS